MKRRHSSALGLSGRKRAAGFSMVELMTAMLLSLLLVAAAVSVFVSNKRVYSSTEGLGRIQESARIAFELMSRDIREAGGNPCDVRMKIVNVLADTTSWWAAYDGVTNTGLSGYNDGGLTGSAANTDAIRVQFFEDTGLVTSAGMGSTSGLLAVDGIGQIEPRQILMACGFFPSSPTEPVTDTAAIFSAGKSGSSINHEEASGNASADFTDAAHPTAVVFPADTLIGSLRAIEWYVADNGAGGNSLYRRQLTYPGTAPVLGAPEEIVNDVTGLTLTYFLGSTETWTTALPTSWNDVTAVQVELELEAGDNRAGGVQGQMIKRKLTHIIALRNKL
jgi:type IV pilus assembly protein PilW